MDVLGVRTMLETMFPMRLYKSAIFSLGSLSGVMNLASQPVAVAADLAATYVPTALLIGDAVQKAIPLVVEQVWSKAGISPRKTMAPGSRVPVEVRALDGNYYHIVLVSPRFHSPWRYI